jgi:hypothetical protein
MEAKSVTANNASASVRVPHQATTITTVTARNNALNSIVVLQSRRSIVDEGVWFATSSPQAAALDLFNPRDLTPGGFSRRAGDCRT